MHPNTKAVIASHKWMHSPCSGMLLGLLKVSLHISVILARLHLREVVVEVAIVKKLGSQIKYGLELCVRRTAIRILNVPDPKLQRPMFNCQGMGRPASGLTPDRTNRRKIVRNMTTPTSTFV
jgi:hypothetical protein